MMLVRFQLGGDFRWGVTDGKEVWAIGGSVYADFVSERRVGSLDHIELLSPCEPTKVVGLAYNYKDLVGKRDQ